MPKKTNSRAFVIYSMKEREHNILLLMSAFTEKMPLIMFKMLNSQTKITNNEGWGKKWREGLLVEENG